MAEMATIDANAFCFSPAKSIRAIHAGQSGWPAGSMRDTKFSYPENTTISTRLPVSETSISDSTPRIGRVLVRPLGTLRPLIGPYKSRLVCQLPKLSPITASGASPYAVGWLKDLTHSTDSGMYLLAACLVAGAALTLSVPTRLVVSKSQLCVKM
jgi:hypothetical protein